MASPSSPRVVALAGGRSPGIDVLRGLAIVLVILHHTGLRIPLRDTVLARIAPRWFVGAITGNGYEAVIVFFVISGFLITVQAQAHWGSLAAIEMRDFYARRAGRILPCLVALVIVLAGLHLLGVDHFTIDRPGQSLGSAVVAALGSHLNWYEGRTGYLPANWDVLWSLSIEELFYLVFPVACLLGADRCWTAWALLLFALSLPLTHAALAGDAIWQEKAYLPGMAAIATGVLAGSFAVRTGVARATTRRWLRALGCIGLTAVCFFEGYLWRVLADGALLVLTGSTAALLLALHGRSVVARPASRTTGWLRSFGRLSYEVYLTHMFVVWLVVDLQRRVDPARTSWALWYLAILVGTWLVGSAIARGLSRPAETWVRRRARGGHGTRAIRASK